jgi:hypothetical protein
VAAAGVAMRYAAWVQPSHAKLVCCLTFSRPDCTVGPGMRTRIEFDPLRSPVSAARRRLAGFVLPLAVRYRRSGIGRSLASPCPEGE